MSIVRGFFSGFGNYLTSMNDARATTKCACHECMCARKRKARRPDTILKTRITFIVKHVLEHSFYALQCPVLLRLN